MDQWQLWLVAALLLFVAEMLAPGFWLLSVAVGCLAAGLVSLIVPGFLVPVLSFAASTLLSLVGIRPVLLKRLHPASSEIRTNVDALVGKLGVVSERIDPTTGRGRVVVEGEEHGAAALRHSIKSYIGISADVRIGAVERSIGKAKRVVDKRPKGA